MRALSAPAAFVLARLRERSNAPALSAGELSELRSIIDGAASGELVLYVAELVALAMWLRTQAWGAELSASVLACAEGAVPALRDLRKEDVAKAMENIRASTEQLLGLGPSTFEPRKPPAAGDVAGGALARFRLTK